MMRGIFVWAVIIFVAAVSYVIAGIVVFQPDRPPPLQFETIDTLITKSQETYRAQTPPEVQRVTLAPDAEKKKAAWAAQIQKVLTQYEEAAIAMPAQAAPILQLITEYTRNGALPPVFHSAADAAAVPFTFAADPRAMLADRGGMDLGCDGVGSAGLSAFLMVGDDQDNRLSCTQTGKATVPRLLLAGPGNDTVRNMAGPSVFVPGTGDDTIENGAGNAAILVLEDAWGRDVWQLNCAASQIATTAIDPDSPWDMPFLNTIIFAPHISRSDIVWNDSKTGLRHLRTGDALDLGGACVNLIFYDQLPSAATVPSS